MSNGADLPDDVELLKALLVEARSLLAERDVEIEQLKAQIAYSTPNRTLIPRQTEHGFHSKPSVDSTANRAGIPRLPERDFHA
jgi:hypothetical protein